MGERVEQPLDVKTTELTQNSRIPGHYGGSLTPARTSEDARSLAEKRWAKWRAAGAQGLRDGTGADSKYTAWRQLTEEQARKAKDGDTRAYLAVGRAVGSLDTPPVEVMRNGAALTLTLDATLADRLLSRLLDARHTTSTPPVSVTDPAPHVPQPGTHAILSDSLTLSAPLLDTLAPTVQATELPTTPRPKRTQRRKPPLTTQTTT